ncbi:MAG: cation transporter [Coxiellaceae bacterium]|nr:MAG: cation transporter [Coxiellaceae bacterium]
MAHSHTHHHSEHHALTPRNLLLVAVVITLCFAAVEAIAGWWSGSLVLLSDAGHMLADSLSLAIAAFAAWIASKPPTDQHTYGLGRAEVIGAWISSLLMVVMVIAIIIEAIARFHEPKTVSGVPVMIVASIGLVVNLGIAWTLSHGEQTLNMRAAIMHVLSDVLGSVVALISGAVIYFTHWTLIDPLLSIFICLLILFSSLQLLRESLLVLMEGVPPHIDLTEVGHAMAKVKNVTAVHDLHIWTLSSGVVMLSAHIEIDDLQQWPQISTAIKHLLDEHYGIDHITLQPETHTAILQPMAYHHRDEHSH